jgi:hypothetical protein
MIAPHQTLVLSLATHSPSHPGHFAALLLLAWLVLPIVDKLALLHLNRAVPLRTPWTSPYRLRHRSLYLDFHINTGADTAGESRCASFTSLRFISSPLFWSGTVDCSAYLSAPHPQSGIYQPPPPTSKIDDSRVPKDAICLYRLGLHACYCPLEPPNFKT